MAFVKRAAFFALTATLLSCASAPAQSPSDVAARIGDRAITVKELDDQWRKGDPAGQAETVQKLYDSRRNALEEIVADMLIAEAAKTRGLSPQAFIQSEITRRVKPVTDTEVTAFYQANITQMQGQSLEAMAPAITRYLTENQDDEARLALIRELRRNGPALRMMFEVPRFEVKLSDADPSIGDPKAPITLIEFSDFQCPYCRQVSPTLKKLRAAYGDKLRIVWKHFPLTQIHPQAFKAGEAGQCAQDQGKFWEYHDQLFGNQQALQLDDLRRYAAASGLDVERFNACVDGSKHAEMVKTTLSEGLQLGVNSTPTVFVNGRRVAGAQPYDVFTAVIDEELSRKK